MIGLLFALGLAACSQAAEPDKPKPSPKPSPSPIPSPTVDLCADLFLVSDQVREIRAGTATADELVAELDSLQSLMTEDGFGDVATALGRLKVEIDTSSDYRFDSAVKLRAKTVSFTALTAALQADCEPP